MYILFLSILPPEDGERVFSHFKDWDVLPNRACFLTQTHKIVLYGIGHCYKQGVQGTRCVSATKSLTLRPPHPPPTLSAEQPDIAFDTSHRSLSVMCPFVFRERERERAGKVLHLGHT